MFRTKTQPRKRVTKQRVRTAKPKDLRGFNLYAGPKRGFLKENLVRSTYHYNLNKQNTDETLLSYLKRVKQDTIPDPNDNQFYGRLRYLHEKFPSASIATQAEREALVGRPQFRKKREIDVTDLTKDDLLVKPEVLQPGVKPEDDAGGGEQKKQTLDDEWLNDFYNNAVPLKPVDAGNGNLIKNVYDDNPVPGDVHSDEKENAIPWYVGHEIKNDLPPLIPDNPNNPNNPSPLRVHLDNPLISGQQNPETIEITAPPISKRFQRVSDENPHLHNHINSILSKMSILPENSNYASLKSEIAYRYANWANVNPRSYQRTHDQTFRDILNDVISKSYRSL